MQEEDDRTLAFLDRRVTLDGIVQKHVELAANAAAPHTSVSDSVHYGVRMSLMDPYVSLPFRQILVVVYITTSNFPTYSMHDPRQNQTSHYSRKNRYFYLSIAPWSRTKF